MLLFPIPSQATSTAAPPGLAVAWLLGMEIKLIARTESKGTPETGHPRQNPKLDRRRRTWWIPRASKVRNQALSEFVWSFSNKEGRMNSS